jgi:hypothetical protein
MLLVDGVHTLVDVIIIDPTRVDLVSWATISCEVATTVAVQVKVDFYCDRFPTDMFSPLTVEVFGCLH